MSQEICIKLLLLCSRIFLRTCGCALIIFYLTLTTCVVYSFFKDVLPFYQDTTSPAFYFIGTILFLLMAFNSAFNYLSAAFRSPGYTKDFKNALQGYGGELDPNLRCDTCQLPKPLNVHHCSFCNRCVINLDHHCPWINNCVGFNNMRYFLLFLFYTFLACFVYSCFAVPVVILKSSSVRFSLIISLNTVATRSTRVVVSVMLFFFNIWSCERYLAMSDQQFIDILKYRQSEHRSEEDPTKNIVWEMRYLRLRFKHIFGTTSFFRALLPAYRELRLETSSFDLETAELITYE